MGERPPLGDHVDAAYFDAIYRSDADPWRYGSDEYELVKYRQQIDWLTAGGTRRFSRALEVACSIGVFTRMLADHCEHVHGIDISSVAVEQARKNLAGVRNVTLDVGRFPDFGQTPPDRYDAVTVAEVLYYFGLAELHQAVDWMREALGHGATVVVTDYVPADRVGFGGEIVHDVLAKELRPHHQRSLRWPDSGLDEAGRAYRMDLFAAS